MSSSPLTLQWKTSVADYKQLTAFRFGTQAELETAMDVLASKDDVRDVPIRPVGRATIFVPDEAVPLMLAHFERRQLDFSAEPVSRLSDMTQEERKRVQNRRVLHY